MKIPKTLKVGGHIYKIINNYKFKEDLLGQSNHRLCEIRLKNSYDGNKMADSSNEEVFMHELLHCVDSIYNDGKTSEDSINRLSQGLYAVLKNNGMLI